MRAMSKTSDRAAYDKAISDYRAYSEQLERERPIFRFIVHIGVLIASLIVIFGAISPIFLPKLYRAAKETMPKAPDGRPILSAFEYDPMLRKRNPSPPVATNT